MKSFPKIIFLATCIFFLGCMATSIGAQEAASRVDSDEDLPQVKHVIADDARELTREEKIESIDDMLQYREDISEAVDGIAIVETPEGSHVEFNGVRLENLSDEEVDALMQTVSQKASQINVENMLETQRQLQNMQHLQQINRQQEMMRNLNRPKVPTVPKPPPKPYTPPNRH